MKEQFNPSSEKYKEVADLPEAEREKYAVAEGNISTGGRIHETGFVKKEAFEEHQLAELAAILNKGEEKARDILQSQAEGYNNVRERIRKDIQGFLENNRGIDPAVKVKFYFDEYNLSLASIFNDVEIATCLINNGCVNEEPQVSKWLRQNCIVPVILLPYK